MAIGSNILRALPALLLALWGGDGVAEPVTLARQVHSAITDRAEPLLKCALDGTGARYRIAVVPWLRAQAGTKSGEYDGFFVAATNAQRDRYAVLAAPLLFEQWVYVSREDRGPIEELVAGGSTVFGANTGTAGRTWLETQKKRGNIKGTVDGAGTIENTWKMFMHDRIGVLLENAPNLDAMLLELKIPRAERQPPWRGSWRCRSISARGSWPTILRFSPGSTVRSNAAGANDRCRASNAAQYRE